jgi:hypothetical protein
MAVPGQRFIARLVFGNSSSLAMAADASFFDLRSVPERDTLCGSAKVHVRSVFPYYLSRCRGVRAGEHEIELPRLCQTPNRFGVRRSERRYNNLAITGAAAPYG